MTSNLFLIPAPIGDRMTDLSVEGLRTLKRVRHLFLEADDSFHLRMREHKVITDDHEVGFLDDAEAAVARAVELIAAGEDFALMASSGIPCFVDPGHEIIDWVLENALDKVEIQPLGVSSALDAGLAMSGQNIQQFNFGGHYRECYLMDKELFAGDVPVVWYVRGDHIRAFCVDIFRHVPNAHAIVLCKDIRKRGRSKVRLVRGRVPDDLVDDVGHDYVAVLRPTREPTEALGKRIRQD